LRLRILNGIPVYSHCALRVTRAVVSFFTLQIEIVINRDALH